MKGRNGTSPIIFLDFDGVLNDLQFFIDRNADESGDRSLAQRHFNPEKVELINKLCDNTGAKVVVSSSWREGSDTEEMRSLMTDVGGTFDIIDITPYIKGVPRGWEIDQWLKCNFNNNKNWVIIDDDSDMPGSQLRHFFRTDSNYGIDKSTCDAIEVFLNK